MRLPVGSTYMEGVYVQIGLSGTNDLRCVHLRVCFLSAGKRKLSVSSLDSWPDECLWRLLLVFVNMSCANESQRSHFEAEK